MKSLQVNIPDNLMERFEKLVAAQGGDDYVSVNTDEVSGKDALFTDLIVLGLDELEDETNFPD